MNKAQELYEKYQADLKELQDTCPHAELTEYMREWSSPGHSTGRSVQLCKECNKVVHSRYSCWNCLEWVYDDQGFEGDGIKHAMGGAWCSESCAEEAEKRGKEMGYSGPMSRVTSCRHCHKKYPREQEYKVKGWAGICSKACADAFFAERAFWKERA